MRNWPNDVMALITAYFDASGTPDTQVLSVGGLVSTAEKWVAFSEAWQEILEAFEVSAFHMKDYAHSNGEFSSWKCDEPKRRRLLRALIRVIEDHVEYTVAHALLMNDYRAMDQKYCLSEFMRPYTFVASSCVGAIGPWARGASYDPDAIAYVFEKGDIDQSDLPRCWESQFPHMRIKPVFFKKSDKYPDPTIRPIRPFEAADLIAYENHKANIQLEDRQEGTVDLNELRYPLQMLLQRLPGAKQWRYSRASNIEKACSRYHVGLRPVAPPPV
jgi:hypothetical protein